MALVLAGKERNAAKSPWSHLLGWQELEKPQMPWCKPGAEHPPEPKTPLIMMLAEKGMSKELVWFGLFCLSGSTTGPGQHCKLAVLHKLNT